MASSSAANTLNSVLSTSTKFKYVILEIPQQEQQEVSSGNIRRLFRVIFSRPTIQKPVSDIVDCEILVEKQESQDDNDASIAIRLAHEKTLRPIKSSSLDAGLELAFDAKTLIRDGIYKQFMTVKTQ